MLKTSAARGAVIVFSIMNPDAAIDPLMAISPLDGRYAGKLAELRPRFSEFGLIRYRVQVEIEWLISLSQCGDIHEVPAFSQAAVDALRKLYTDFQPADAREIKNTEAVTNHDVKAVEYYLKKHCAAIDEVQPVLEFIHFACTSEDINNLAYGLMLKEALAGLVLPAMEEIQQQLSDLADANRSVSMLARTHGQPASPTTLGKEFFNVSERLARQINQIGKLDMLGKLNGATGNFNAHLAAYPDVDWMALSRSFVERLELRWNPHTTQIEPHDYMAELFHAVCRFNTGSTVKSGRTFRLDTSGNAASTAKWARPLCRTRSIPLISKTRKAIWVWRTPCSGIWRTSCQ